MVLLKPSNVWFYCKACLLRKCVTSTCIGKKYAELHGGGGGDKKKKEAKPQQPKKEQPPKQEKKVKYKLWI